jgi:hypothetical protein
VVAGRRDEDATLPVIPRAGEGVSNVQGRVRLEANLDLADIQPLLDNPGLGGPYPEFGGRDLVGLSSTNVTCENVALLEAKDIIVFSDCP